MGLRQMINLLAKLSVERKKKNIRKDILYLNYTNLPSTLYHWLLGKSVVVSVVNRRIDYTEPWNLP